MGTGGIRWGAGRPGYRAKAEHLQRVDIRQWQRGGYLRAGCYFSWSWNRGGEPSGSIAVQVDGRESLRLLYQIGPEDERRDGSQSVAIAWTGCHFGGARAWFHCPACGRRRAVLYLRSGRFACRHCQRVAYSSQSEDLLGRTWRRQAKIEARLGDGWKRPKGMRWETYDRLLARITKCEEERDAGLALALSRLGWH